MVVAIIDWQHVPVHPDVAATVDAILLGQPFRAEVRERSDDGEVTVLNRASRPASAHREPERGGAGWNGTGRRSPRAELAFDSRTGQAAPVGASAPAVPSGKPLRIYPYGLATNRLERAIRSLNVAASLVRDIASADAVLTLKSYFRKKPQPLRDAEDSGVPIHVLKSNTEAQMGTALAVIFHVGMDPTTVAMQEAEDASHEVLNTAGTVELAPQNSYVRRMQHTIAERYNLSSKSRGAEPNRRVRIYKPGAAMSQDWAGD
ncbi:MAG: R3H domain-containing nucleic acid-binding protein [Dehalococcoidia bacterium]